MFGLRSPDSLLSFNPSRIAIIKPSALGDVTNAFHPLAALRRLWPQASITWVINHNLRALVDGHPDIDAVIPFDRARANPLSFLAFLRLLHQQHFDLAIDLQGLLRSALMTAATAAPIRIGLADAREAAPWFYTHRIIPPGSIDQAHAIDRLLAIPLALGANIDHLSPKVALTEADRSWARQTLAPLPRPRLALNLGARWETKRWPPTHFAEVARRAHQHQQASLFAIGAPEDRPLVDEMISLLDPIPVLDLCGKTSLPRLAALAQQADVVLSNDTGPLHLAAVAGARVLGIYTCTTPALNGPHGPLAASVQTHVPCAGSYLVKCPRQFICMNDLTPDRLWPSLLTQLLAAQAAAASVA